MSVVLLVMLAVLVALVLFKRIGQIPATKATALLRQGARVIDVRSPSEFGQSPVPGAINIPLGQLSAEIAGRLPDLSEPLLLHCLSGGRSMVAVRILRRRGYLQAHNLGSVGRARRLVNSARSEAGSGQGP
jgi:phage shock protein E